MMSSNTARFWSFYLLGIQGSVSLLTVEILQGYTQRSRSDLHNDGKMLVVAMSQTVFGDGGNSVLYQANRNSKTLLITTSVQVSTGCCLLPISLSVGLSLKTVFSLGLRVGWNYPQAVPILRD